MYRADVTAQPVRSHFLGELENVRVSQAPWMRGWWSLPESCCGGVCDCLVRDRLLPLNQVLVSEENGTEPARSRRGASEALGEVM